MTINESEQQISNYHITRPVMNQSPPTGLLNNLKKASGLLASNVLLDPGSNEESKVLVALSPQQVNDLSEEA